MLSHSSSDFAEIRDDSDLIVATVRGELTTDRLEISARLAPDANAWSDILAPLRDRAIMLLPNGMLRLAGDERGEDLSEFIHTASDGRLHLCKNPSGIEHGLAMKQQVWAQEEHTVPFNRLVASLQNDSSRTER
ncbi:MAG: hypothetical protein KY475_18535 [Planctomycetes bacterium]|nr:hypothetical protein [Planctomycetota bacterium]